MLRECISPAILETFSRQFYMRIRSFPMEEYDRGNPLFDQRLNILIQSVDREEKTLPITVRLVLGTRVRASKHCNPQIPNSSL